MLAIFHRLHVDENLYALVFGGMCEGCLISLGEALLLNYPWYNCCVAQMAQPLYDIMQPSCSHHVHVDPSPSLTSPHYNTVPTHTPTLTPLPIRERSQ